jgi:serine/threonine-protein kinase
MGEVYVAIQEPLGRKVALKLMRPGLTAAASARFEREAKSLAQTPHPNIVTLFDFGRTDSGELFMAMELLPGQSLRERQAAIGRLLTKDALKTVRDICKALDATHKAGIVHRDLKPENVMLVTVGAEEVVKVLDFGIARLQEGNDDAARITKTGYLLGTPGYMAPEMVLEGVFDDPRSDLYAVGVILWELLTSYALFSAPTPIALVMRHAQEPPPTLSAVSSPTQPPHPTLQTLVSTLLAKDRRDRFSSAQAVIDAIDALPPEACSPFAVLASPLAAAPTLMRAPAVDNARRSSADLAPHDNTLGDSRLAMATPAALTAVTPPPMPTMSSGPSAPTPSKAPSTLRTAAISALVVALLGGIALVWMGRPTPPTPVTATTPTPPEPTTPATPTTTPSPDAPPEAPERQPPDEVVAPETEPDKTPEKAPGPAPVKRPKPRPKKTPPPSPQAQPHVPDLT